MTFRAEKLLTHSTLSQGLVTGDEQQVIVLQVDGQVACLGLVRQVVDLQGVCGAEGGEPRQSRAATS